MKPVRENRFQEFFEDDKYVSLKNYLYNYLLRRCAVKKALRGERPSWLLEVGSGMSPVTDANLHVIYTDLSYLAMVNLRRVQGGGGYIVADAMNLPFRSGVFSHIISSEVLEHLPDDQAALTEMSRVMDSSGSAIITFPHGRYYFALDDRFVNHYRRYSLDEMLDNLEKAGLKPVLIRKILGPLEKIIMCLAVFCFSVLRKRKAEKSSADSPTPAKTLATLAFKWSNRAIACVAWLDARIAPRALSTVLMVRAIRRNG